jgi:hypothetical protein
VNTKSTWKIGLGAGSGLLLLALAVAEGPAADGLLALTALIVLGICLVALIVVEAALWPGVCLRARHSLETSPGKTFLVGLINYLFLGGIGLVLLNLGPIGILALPLLAILLLGTLLGLPAAAGLSGQRLYALQEREVDRWQETVAGSIGLYLAALLPVAGWFLLLPALCLWSLGATILALISRRRRAEAMPQIGE